MFILKDFYCVSSSFRKTCAIVCHDHNRNRIVGAIVYDSDLESDASTRSDIDCPYAE